MNLHGKDIRIFTANSNKPVAEEIAKELGLPMGQSEVVTFSDGEISVSIQESIRGSDVFVVQSLSSPVNDNLMELLIMIDAFKRASAGRITAVIPYMGYARQDRKAKARDPISAKLVADLITTAGADRVLSMDLHCPIVDKRRQKANVCEVMNIIGDVRDKRVVLVDDMIDTAGTLCNAAKAIIDIGGAKEVYACATHGVLSGPAIERISASPIKELVLLDTIALPAEKQIDKITMLHVAPVFAKAIQRIYDDEPVSPLFNI